MAQKQKGVIPVTDLDASSWMLCIQYYRFLKVGGRGGAADLQSLSREKCPSLLCKVLLPLC